MQPAGRSLASPELGKPQSAATNFMRIIRFSAPSRGGRVDGQVRVRVPRAATTTINNFQGTGVRLQLGHPQTWTP